jgi:hypothetical protein
MSGRPTTYSTVLPDDTSDDHGHINYSSKVRDSNPVGSNPQLRDVPPHYKGQENTDRDKRAIDDRKHVPLDEREMLKKQITSNKMIVYGLLLVAAILMVALGYMVIQNRKFSPVDAPTINTQSSSHTDPGPPSQQMYEYPSTELPATNNMGSNARATAQNDKLLRQRQHRTPVQSKQSALARRRQGHSDHDDRQRLAAIIEENESKEDDVAARTRSYIANQLKEDAAADAQDEPLGTGSFELNEGDDDVSGSQAYYKPQTVECKDDALINQDDIGADADADDDTDDTPTQSAKVAALCSVILVSGSRVGQECNRECAPGKTMCKSHLGVNARKK